MGRRFGMWTAMISVLVVGVFLTKMTNDFVSSNGVEAAAITNVMDTSIPFTSGMGAVESAVESISNRAAVMPAEAHEPAAVSETLVLEETVHETILAVEEDMMPDVLPAAEEALIAEEFEKTENEDGGVDPEGPMIEAVKSPLDPVVEEEGPFSEESYLNTVMDASYFLERFSTAEASTAALWDMVSPEHSGAYYSAAEQEHVLWEHELNLVFSTVRDSLADDEIEKLNSLESEWMKEREQYANKSLSAVKNKAVQSAEYLQALTLMTKERCYWLIDVYGELLNSKE